MILYLGNKLSAHGFTPTGVETLGEKLQSAGWPVVTKSSVRNQILRLADMLFAVLRYRRRAGLVMIDTYSTSGFWFAFLSGMLCRWLGIRYVPVLRGGQLPERLERNPKLASLLFRHSWCNAAASEYLAQAFSRKNYPVKVIHNYINTGDYTFQLRKHARPRLLWVRSFHQIYNPVMALQVFGKLKSVYPDATLCMIGPDKDGSLESCKRYAAEHDLPVEFTGLLSKKEWTAKSKEFDIFINTTHIDNTPVSVMEAMALGMPVVSTRVGGIPYLFENGTEGLMVPDNDPDEMLKAILKLVRDPEYTEAVSAAARQKACTWDWSRIQSLWVSLFESAGIKSANKETGL